MSGVRGGRAGTARRCRARHGQLDRPRARDRAAPRRSAGSASTPPCATAASRRGGAAGRRGARRRARRAAARPHRPASIDRRRGRRPSPSAPAASSGSSTTAASACAAASRTAPRTRSAGVFETNVFGTIAVTKAVLPHMRAARLRADRHGHVGRRAHLRLRRRRLLREQVRAGGARRGRSRSSSRRSASSPCIVEPGIIKTSRWGEHRGTAAARERPGEPVPRAASARARRSPTGSCERSPTRPADVAATSPRRSPPSSRGCATSSAAGRASWCSPAPPSARADVRAALLRRAAASPGAAHRTQRRRAAIHGGPGAGARRMSRFLFTLLAVHRPRAPADEPSRAALRERGHEVAFYSGDAVRATVRGRGLRVLPASTGSTRSARSPHMRAMEDGGVPGRPGRGRVLPLLRDWLVETIPDQVADLDAVLADWRAGRRSPPTCRCGAPSWSCGSRGPDPGRALLDVHGPADPRARRAGLRLRPARRRGTRARARPRARHHAR